MATPSTHRITQYYVPEDCSLDNAVTDLRREIERGRTVTIIKGGITLFVQGSYAPCSYCGRPATERPETDSRCPSCHATGGRR